MYLSWILCNGFEVVVAPLWSDLCLKGQFESPAKTIKKTALIYYNLVVMQHIKLITYVGGGAS